MPAPIVPASFQDVGEPDEVGIHIGMGVNERMPHAGLSPEMDDMGEAVFGKQARHALAIGQIQPGKPKVGVRCQLCQTRFLQGWIVVGVEVVQTYDRFPVVQKSARNMVADKSGRAGN